MAVRIRQLPRAASQWRKFAKQLGAQVVRGGGGSRVRTVDGYLFRAVGDGQNASVVVLDPAAKLAFCQPYLVELPETATLTLAPWRVVDVRAGRDPWRLPGDPLSYGVSTGDVTDNDVRSRWYRGTLPIGDAVERGQYTARGVFAHYPQAITTANVLTDAAGETDPAGRFEVGTPTWLVLWRMNIQQRMFRLSQTPEEIAAAGRDVPSSIEQMSNVSLAADELLPVDVSLGPMGDNRSITAYTCTPGYVGFDVNSGVFYAHSFERVGTVSGALSDYGLRTGIVVGRYHVEDPGPTADARYAVKDWSTHLQAPALFAGTSLDDTDSTASERPTTELGLMRGAFTPAGGLLVAAARRTVLWTESSIDYSDRARGLLVLAVSGTGVVTVQRNDVWALDYQDDPVLYHYTPVLGVTTGMTPVVVSHRFASTTAWPNQAAADVALVLFTADGSEQVVDLGDYFPVTYVPRDSGFMDGRLNLIYDYPVSTGDWQLQVVQAVCQCGADELAVLVRPAAQFTDPSLDLHVAIVRISTGAVLAVGPATVPGSLWALASVTCVTQGVWAVDGTEVSPATLQVNLFREAGAPAEPAPLVRGTYLSVDSGRSLALLVDYGASLVYYLGNVTAPVPIGG